MWCPLDANNGFIELTGPITNDDIKSITVKNYPLSIAFTKRAIVPTMYKNIIDEKTAGASNNTCTYQGVKYTLVDVQICKVMNKGYVLPGMNKEAAAELIITFKSTNTTETPGILLCMPIYNSGISRHADYIKQLISTNTPNCKYTFTNEKEYTGDENRSFNTNSVTNCIIAACNDPKIVAYTYNRSTNKCILFDTNPSKIQKSMNSISGTVNHNVSNSSTDSCESKSATDELKVASLESIFYSSDADTSQTSIAYKTCFEIVDTTGISSKSLYVVVFPTGIELTNRSFQQLLLQFNGSLTPYMVPPDIRKADSDSLPSPTVQKFTINAGEKKATLESEDGFISSSTIPVCDEKFKQRFEYFTLPPRTSFTKTVNNKCPYYQTSQYKCVPFNQLKDLSGAYVIPGNKTLEEIMQEEKDELLKNQNLYSSDGANTDGSENTVAIMLTIGIFVVVAVGIFKMVKL